MRILVAILLLGSTLRAADLQSQLNQMAAQHHGRVALYAKNLKTGASVAIDSDKPVPTASVIKLPIMIEAFYQAKAGKLDLSRRIPLTKDNQVEGSGVFTFMQPGLNPAIEDAVTLMIILSDNTATNMVIDQVSIPAVNARIAAMGLKNTYLYKKVFKPVEGPVPADQKQFGLGKTTAREMAEAMASIARCDLGDLALCKKMIAILRNQQDREMIPRFLEISDTSETGSAVANKTGALDEVRNDVALVSTKAGDIVISIFTYDNQDHSWRPENEAELLIARLAKLIVDTWAPSGLAKHPAP